MEKEDPFDKVIHKINLKREQFLKVNTQNDQKNETLSKQLTKFKPSGIKAYLNSENQKQ